ncbi:NUDIX domain-containing protein [Promicromonospora citrea]|uniref:NUDIX hydrolase n=1 Tax=Promicromonospora citrea TaxID=43677 RepID=A0A8H9GGH8_9MICO|nr:NUDIX domain-containing protein [Promicromonospora citrea]NNH53212.1 NUDIX hydrolase [Promicromonospora citrea]GGM24188.1 NUDIX hydrolase [Promicromonospora citrea]
MSGTSDLWEPPEIQVAVDIVILTMRASVFHVLLIERGEEPQAGTQALPGGFLNNKWEGIYDAALRELKEEADLDASGLHVEQLAAYGEPGRDPRGRVLSVAYMAIAPGLPEPSAGTDASDAAWVPVEDVLSGKVSLAFDHRQIVRDAVERARSKLERTSLALAFCGRTFTLTELQHVYEGVWGCSLDPRNFYRKVQNIPGFVEPAGSVRRMAAGRPARLFRAGGGTVLYPPMVRPVPTES